MTTSRRRPMARQAGAAREALPAACRSALTRPRKRCRASQFTRNGVADGARTHDNRNHNPGLYQLSYSHHRTVNYSERPFRSAVQAAQREVLVAASADSAALLIVTL